MAKLIVSGASDDLIEVDGDVKLEGYPDMRASGNDAAAVLVNGTPLLRVEYTDDGDGVWRVVQLAELPGIEVQIVRTPGEDEGHGPDAPSCVKAYSDYAVVTGDITEVSVPGDSWKR